MTLVHYFNFKRKRKDCINESWTYNPDLKDTKSALKAENCICWENLSFIKLICNATQTEYRKIKFSLSTCHHIDLEEIFFLPAGLVTPYPPQWENLFISCTKINPNLKLWKLTLLENYKKTFVTKTDTENRYIKT